MVKETFSRNKPGGYNIPPPVVESFSSQIVIDVGAFDQAELTVVGSSDSGFLLALYATPPVGTGVMSPSNSLFRLMMSVTPVYSPTAIDFGTQYQALFGLPEAGAKIFLRLVYIDTDSGQIFKAGQLSVITTSV